MNWQKITIIILAVALFSATQYIILEKWEEMKNKEIMIQYQVGYDKASQNIITALFKSTNDCKIATIHAENLTKQLVDVKCVNQQK